MTQTESDRLSCPSCGEHNRPGVKPLIEVVGRDVTCGVCGATGTPERFMPWLKVKR